MKFTIDHLQQLNGRLPPGYLLEIKESPPPQTLPPMTSQPRPLVPAKVPVPQPVATYTVRPSRSQVSEGFRKLFAILSKLKKHPGSAYFQGSEKVGREGQEINIAIVEGRLFREEYENGRQFAEDLRQMSAGALLKLASDTFATNEILSFRHYFETMMSGNEDILLTLRKQQKLSSDTGSCASALSEEERKTLIRKIRALDEKYLRGIAETLQATEVTKFLDRIEERLKELQPAALFGLAQHVETCLAKSRRLPGPQLTPVEPPSPGGVRSPSTACRGFQ